ncbi:MAG: D-mannonate oxidoreductase [Bacteroidetes bacterium GWF2_42_66]|nr:MAG: D-mannonate oxidoreductase [Bacteroidetes bacterium GWA2_42_15]OFX96510.1 MAG: D-mannonate oxidoreductase [Bacteroidetes bacterium GWE2_42_39]OFY40930.1 MAG: D-mannonate oxidoreductase [Bacteroidetes bacterium GWF2_42_66]HBL76365.1 D-mannonate oxidoreductase [Prolixibacteraceae bacterium]HCR92081.1 D-mannonate oxidoreductase [Prolixibacteraceae bacterium]
MTIQMNGKIAIVTGAGGTLCSEMARNLAQQGAKVALIGRNLEKLKKVEQEITKNGGAAISVSADVTDQSQVEAARMTIINTFGFCDILINGAGGNQPDAVTTISEFNDEELNQEKGIRGFFNLSMEKFSNVIETNTMGTVIPCFVFGKDMAEKKSGVIINIASMNSFRPLSRVGAYGMAKAGIMNFTQWLAAYLAPANIRVNAIAPGFFLNERSTKLLTTPDGGFTERGGNIIRQTPLKRFGKASELIGCINWLIDDEAAGFVTGITIPVDGGFLADSGI